MNITQEGQNPKATISPTLIHALWSLSQDAMAAYKANLEGRSGDLSALGRSIRRVENELMKLDGGF